MPFTRNFRPPGWLRHAHLQSMMPSLPLRVRRVVARAAALRAASREVLLDCGDGVRLQGFHARHSSPARDLVVIHHGWEGSADSSYVLSLGARLWDAGYDVFRLNLRDHGDTHHLNEELFHSCRLDEVIAAVVGIQALAPQQRLSLVGYSLGGNFALRVAARAPAVGLRIARVVAVCPVLDPASTLHALEHGFWLYKRYFILKWSRSLRLKQRAFPHRYDFGDLTRERNLTRMTEKLVLQHTGYASLDEYLRGYAIAHGFLNDLTVPSRLITALDDPIIPARDLKLLEGTPNLRITVTPHGGHCGFLESLDGKVWVDDEILHELRAGLPAAESLAGDHGDIIRA